MSALKEHLTKFVHEIDRAFDDVTNHPNQEEAIAARLNVETQQEKHRYDVVEKRILEAIETLLPQPSHILYSKSADDDDDEGKQEHRNGISIGINENGMTMKDRTMSVSELAHVIRSLHIVQARQIRRLEQQLAATTTTTQPPPTTETVEGVSPSTREAFDRAEQALASAEKAVLGSSSSIEDVVDDGGGDEVSYLGEERGNDDDDVGDGHLHATSDRDEDTSSFYWNESKQAPSVSFSSFMTSEEKGGEDLAETRRDYWDTPRPRLDHRINLPLTTSTGNKGTTHAEVGLTPTRTSPRYIDARVHVPSTSVIITKLDVVPEEESSGSSDNLRSSQRESSERDGGMSHDFREDTRKVRVDDRHGRMQRSTYSGELVSLRQWSDPQQAKSQSGLNRRHSIKSLDKENQVNQQKDFLSSNYDGSRLFSDMRESTTKRTHGQETTLVDDDAAIQRSSRHREESKPSSSKKVFAEAAKDKLTPRQHDEVEGFATWGQGDDAESTLHDEEEYTFYTHTVVADQDDSTLFTGSMMDADAASRRRLEEGDGISLKHYHNPSHQQSADRKRASWGAVGADEEPAPTSANTSIDTVTLQTDDNTRVQNEGETASYYAGRSEEKLSSTSRETPFLDRYRLDEDDESPYGFRVVPNLRRSAHKRAKSAPGNERVTHGSSAAKMVEKRRSFKVAGSSGMIRQVQSSEYDGAPRIVQMQVSLGEVQTAVQAINKEIGRRGPRSPQQHLHYSAEESSFSLDLPTAHDILEPFGFSPRKRKSLLMSLCNFRRLQMKQQEIKSTGGMGIDDSNDSSIVFTVEDDDGGWHR